MTIIWIAINSRCFFFSHCYILLLSISFHIFRSGACHRIGSLAGAARASSSSACSHPGGGSKIWLTAWDKPWQAQLPNCPTSRWFSLILVDFCRLVLPFIINAAIILFYWSQPVVACSVSAWVQFMRFGTALKLWEVEGSTTSTPQIEPLVERDLKAL